METSRVTFEHACAATTTVPSSANARRSLGGVNITKALLFKMEKRSKVTATAVESKRRRGGSVLL